MQLIVRLTRQLQLVLWQGILPVQYVVPQPSATPGLLSEHDAQGMAGREAGGRQAGGTRCATRQGLSAWPLWQST